MSEYKLLPCPFCGSEAEMIETNIGDFKVCCTSCEVSTSNHASSIRAIMVWNRRAPVIAEAVDP